ncbi:MAG: hypothetical protein PWQ37_1007 [Candidatus Petromonas sp.]|nr:hypothetical protein [Candidatus Petromonas sp.]
MSFYNLWGEFMRFYVISKCIAQQNGDIVLNLETMELKKIKLNQELQEDRTYVIANGQIISIRNIAWDITDTYFEAFGKSRKIKKGDFKFLKINKNSCIYVDDNYFMFKSDKLIGRIVNKGEIEKIDKMGIERFNKLLKNLYTEDIVALINGKKIYRIFTYTKLKTLVNNNNKNQINLCQYLNKNNTEEILQKLKKNIDTAYENLDEAIKYINEELDKR